MAPEIEDPEEPGWGQLEVSVGMVKGTLSDWGQRSISHVGVVYFSP